MDSEVRMAQEAAAEAAKDHKSESKNCQMIFGVLAATNVLMNSLTPRIPVCFFRRW